MVLVIFIFGWPAVLASLLVTAGAVLKGSPKLAAAGVLLALPFMSYMFATPRFRLLAPPIFLAHLASAFALRAGRRVLALMLFGPFACLVALVARLVVQQWIG